MSDHKKIGTVVMIDILMLVPIALLISIFNYFSSVKINFYLGLVLVFALSTVPSFLLNKTYIKLEKKKLFWINFIFFFACPAVLYILIGILFYLSPTEMSPVM